MTRVLCLTIAVMLILAVSVVVDPPHGFDGRGMVAVAVAVAVLRVMARTERGRA